MLSAPTLLSPIEYIQDVTKQITKATSRVFLLSMIITDDASTNQLIEALSAAARRGVRVEVAADIFTYSELSGAFRPSHYYSKKVRSTTRMTRRLVSSGVRFRWLGQLSSTLFSGRTHAKWCIVDNIIYSFGGVNIYQKAIDNSDYMFKLTNHHLANCLVAEQLRIIQTDKAYFRNKSRKISYDIGVVYIDGGLMGDSIIYRRACQLAQAAESILFVSQYCPTGRLSRLFKKTKSKLYFNPWQNATGSNRFIIRLGMALTRQSTLYSHDRYVHSKFIIFTMPDGKKIALSGSHNFAYSGVLAGTREIALETADAKTIKQLETYFKQYII